MKARNLIALFLPLVLVACDKPNALQESDKWSVTVYTTLQYENNPYNEGIDTLYSRYSGWPAELYKYFDISMTDTMVMVADTPWSQYTFPLANGECISPVNIYIYDNGYVHIGDLTEDKYLLLRLTKARWSYRYEWLELNRSQRNSVVFDTVSHCGLDKI